MAGEVAVNADETWMARAVDLAWTARVEAHPNPWVGAVVVDAEGELAGEGATAAPGGPHAEVVALAQAGGRAKGATLYVTLEPCSHWGRTPPCAEAVIAAQVARVVVAVADPDPKVAGSGLARLRQAGVEVVVGLLEDQVEGQLAPYLAQRRRGRPWVVLKLALSVDGRIAGPDSSSKWITGPAARADAHVLRAMSDAIVVGANTVRQDDPELTVRLAEGRSPKRVVLGEPPPGARVMPAEVHKGDLLELLDRLGAEGALQVLFEGGAQVAGQLHRQGLVDQYVFYLAPVLLGGDDGLAAFAGPGAPSLEAAWRGRIAGVRHLGPDLRIDLVALGTRFAVP